jgi:UDP-N-acetylmuramyl pentapeptide phosphotransferase/UDP-N-acetylglucosamine-1-phosphate transferase
VSASFAFSLAVAFAASVAVTRVAELVGRRNALLDIPNERSSHDVPTPRIGGVGIIAGTIAGWLVAIGTPDVTLAVIVGASLLLAVVGLIDDLRKTSVLIKYSAQFVAAAAVALAIGPSLGVSVLGFEVVIGGPVAWLVVTIWLTALTNAVNFMDGIDGLIGGVAAMVCLLATGLVAPGAVPLLACVAVACLGFLVWNQAPATVFMGDVGSQFLGLIIGAALLLQPAGTPAIAPVVLLVAPLLLDTGYTLVARAIAGKDVLAGHREHLYQRLVVAGRSHREVAAGYVVASALTGSLAIAWADMPAVLQALAIAAVVGGSVAYVMVVRRAEARAVVGGGGSAERADPG